MLDFAPKQTFREKRHQYPMTERPVNLIGLPRTVFFIAGSILLFLISLAGLACKSGYPAASRQGADSKTVAREVKTARVVEMPVGQTVTVNGTLAAYDQTTVSVKVPGRLKTITVDLGSVVRRGQLIGQLEPGDYNLRVQQSEAALAQARARLGLSPEGL